MPQKIHCIVGGARLSRMNQKSADPNELQVRLFGPHPACLDGADDGLLTDDTSQLVRPHPPRADGESDSLAIVAQ